MTGLFELSKMKIKSCACVHVYVHARMCVCVCTFVQEYMCVRVCVYYRLNFSLLQQRPCKS